MPALVLNIFEGLRDRFELQPEDYPQFIHGQQEPSPAFPKPWLTAGFTVFALCIAGVLALTSGYDIIGYIILTVVPASCILYCMQRYVNWGSCLGYLRRICCCRTAESLETPSATQPLLQPSPTLPLPRPFIATRPVPEPPILQMSVQELVCRKTVKKPLFLERVEETALQQGAVRKKVILQEPVEEPVILLEPVEEPVILQEPVEEPVILQEPVEELVILP